MTDIKSVLADAEDLLKQAANTSGERAAELSAKALTLLEQAREKASDLQVVVVEKSRQAARATDDYVHDHPWQAAAVGTGIGVVIGLLLNRK
ncbi:membrane protein [Pandoraea sputorum]|uniref:DUF883 family protein n=1 Tax=Pandoraea sputorum TaxID=93222 RepID=UPI001240D5EE|nr:DUF883 family protein [Pandoraea sputorum]VVE59620.1 membrane protein [Pandoraea sputorum]